MLNRLSEPRNQGFGEWHMISGKQLEKMDDRGKKKVIVEGKWDKRFQ